MSRPLALVLLATFLVAGCFDPNDPDEADDPPEAGPATAPEPPGPGVSPGGAGDASTASAPDWEPGDWWRWEVTGRGFDTYTLTTVVARAIDGGYHIGVTELEPSLHAHILHVPPQGPVMMPALAWHAHGEDMTLIDFPLHDGKSWEGSVEGRPLTFTASAETRGGHTVYAVDSTYTDFESQGPRYVYDPTIGMFSELHLHYGGSEPFSSARVVDSGTGHTGELRLPTSRDKFLDGAGGPTALLDSTGGFTAPAEKVWLVFACYLGGETGSYGITYVTPAPNEDPLRCVHQNESPDFTNDIQVMWRASVPGDWTIVFDVIGNGYAEAEVIGVVEETCALAAEGDLEPC